MIKYASRICFTRLVHEPLAMVASIMHRLVRVVLRGVNRASMAVGVLAAHWCSQTPADVLRRVHNRVPATYGDSQVATPNIPAELKNSAYIPAELNFAVSTTASLPHTVTVRWPPQTSLQN